MTNDKVELTEQELLQLKMVGGGTIQDLINKYPENEEVRSAIIAGTYRCLRNKLDLHELNIAMASRAIAREEIAKRKKDKGQ